MPRTIHLAANTAPLTETLAEIARLLPESADLPREVAERLLDIAHDPANAFRVDAEVGAARGTHEIRIRFEPSDRLLESLTALRAWHGELPGRRDVAPHDASSSDGSPLTR